jgi:hypothetical protein
MAGGDSRRYWCFGVPFVRDPFARAEPEPRRAFKCRVRIGPTTPQPIEDEDDDDDENEMSWDSARAGSGSARDWARQTKEQRTPLEPWKDGDSFGSLALPRALRAASPYRPIAHSPFRPTPSVLALQACKANGAGYC